MDINIIYVHKTTMKLDCLELELKEERKAQIKFQEQFGHQSNFRKVVIIFVWSRTNLFTQSSPGCAVKDLAQYECEHCEEQHYHTKKNVETHLQTKHIN